MLQIFYGPDSVATLTEATAVAEDLIPEDFRGADLLVEFPSSGKWAISDIRNLVQGELSQYPFGESRVLILDQFQTAGNRESDALLKRVEEPVPGVAVFLCVSSLDDVSKTLLSRTLYRTEVKARSEKEISAAAAKPLSKEWLTALKSSAALWSIADSEDVAKLFQPNFLSSTTPATGLEAACVLENALKSKHKSKLPSGYLKLAATAWLDALLNAKLANSSEDTELLWQAKEMLLVNIPAKQALSLATVQDVYI